jgi:O-antigen ligase
MGVMVISSTLLNIALGRYMFYYGDMYYPIIFVRMMLIAAIAASFYFGPDQVRQFFKGLVLLSLTTAALAIAQKLKLFGLESIIGKLYSMSVEQLGTLERETEFSRVVGTFGNANVYGGCMVMLAALMISYVMNAKRGAKIVGLICYLSLALAIVWTTSSRTSLVGLVIVTGMAIVLSFSGKARIGAFILLIITAISLLFLRDFAQQLPLDPRIKSFIGGQDVSTIESFQVRLQMWEHSLSVAKQSIFIGVGATKTVVQETDNGYVYTLMRIGLLGFCVYITMLILMVIRGFRGLRLALGTPVKTLILGMLLILLNDLIFEMTGEFFWHIRYGAVISAMFGFLCGASKQAIQDYNQNYQQDSSEEFSLEVGSIEQ